VREWLIQAKASLRLADVFQLLDSLGRNHFLIHRQSVPILQQSAGPPDGELIHGRNASRTEMRDQTVLRIVAAAAHHLAHSLAAAGGNDDPGSDSAAVGLCSCNRDVKKVPAAASVVK